MTQTKSIDGLKVRAPKPSHSNEVIFNSRSSKPAPKKVVIKEEPIKDTTPATLPPELLDAFDDTEEENNSLPDELLNAFDDNKEEKEEKKEKSSPEPKPKKKKSKVKKIILSVVVVLILAVIGAGTYFVVWGNDLIQKLTGGNSTIWDAIATLTSDDYVELKTDNNGRVNILVIGTSGFDMSGDNGGGIHDGADLTDTIMVVSVNPKTGDIAMLSVPRDLKSLKPCTGTGKINETYWCNITYGASEADANRALESELTSMLGISFQYFAHVNWGSVVTVVETLGGITVTLDDDVNDTREGNEITIEAGVPTTLNGIEALRLARARYGVVDGDFSRTEHQQKILMAIKDKIASSDLSITDLLNLASALGDNLRTDVSIEEMKSAAHLLLDSGFDLATARQIPLTVHDYLRYAPCNNGASCIAPRAGDNNYFAIRSYVKDELLTDPLKRENAKILALNATGKDGIAATVRSKIEGNTGLEIADVGNAPEADYPAAYTIYNLTGRAPLSLQTLQKLFKNHIVLGSESLPEGVSNNYDIVIVVTSAALPASSL